MVDRRDAARRLDLSGRLVLVVEDNESCAEAVSDWLASCGALVETADSVRGALERVRTASPDVALIDICLPDGSGWDCVDRIRTATMGGKLMPVIAITGYAQRDVAREAAEHGVRYVVTKPIEPDALASVLDACLDAAASRATSPARDGISARAARAAERSERGVRTRRASPDGARGASPSLI